MRTVKSASEIREIDTQKYSGHANFYLDETTPIVYTQCPNCKGDIHRGMVSCPDGREGCCVAHYGFGCKDCRKVFEMQVDYEGEPDGPWKVKETIGLAVINPRGIARLRLAKG